MKRAFAVRHPIETYRIARSPSRLAGIIGRSQSPSTVRRWLDEAAAITATLRSRLKAQSWLPGKVDGSTAMPDRGPFIYATARAIRPKLVVETGVASGASTVYILAALEKNREGTLHSVDLPPDEWADAGLHESDRVDLPRGLGPGWLVPECLRDRWVFHAGDSRSVLPKLLNELETITFFFHDSEHTYDLMRLEFETAWSHMEKGGILASDDIGWNQAFDDFTRVHQSPFARIGPMGFARKVRSVG